MRMVDLIIKKRDGHELTDEEISFWIDGYTKGEIPDYQSSAMQMAILFRGMNNREIATLTDRMEHSGEVLDLSHLKGVKVDKHSTGGVGDKTSLVLGPMVAACGATLAKMSGRGLGHTGGTLDKLESIPGVTIAIEGERFAKQVNSIGCAIVGQTGSLVPADKKMYALRDVTGTVESIPLIAASVMSKKLASGSDAILLDVTVGDGAFMKNMDDARKLAHIMVDIGNRLGRNTKAVLSDMSEPLGLAVGNALEVKEAIDALHGHGPEDLMELCYTAGSIMLVQANCAKDYAEGRKKLEEAISSGAAFDKFVKMIEAQGGDISYILHPEKFVLAKNLIEIRSEVDGYVQSLNALEIGISSMQLGGGRETLEDTIDMSAGIVLNKKVGDKVTKGELLCTLHTNKDEKTYQAIIEDVKKAFKFSKDPVATQPVIREIIEN
ncbi:MAG: pyrimidine-nucleoside phosphorylase [Bacilli bacterium]|nr:pyrimidine-nucleoside phosphorylase [Bacilli bacterium]